MGNDRLKRAAWSTAVFCLLSALDVPTVRAFDQAGHFFTMLAIARTVLPSPRSDEQELVAFCAQLPDMAKDLDAAAIYTETIFSRSFFDWARWGLLTSVDSAAIKKMITVQHLLHGLTGGDAPALQQVAVRVLANLRANVEAGIGNGVDPGASLCALGFAIHFLFDSHAHVKLEDTPKSAPERKMYETGKGHAGDRHYPDYPLCSDLNSWPRLRRHCTFSEDSDKRFAAWGRLLTDPTNGLDPPSCVACGKIARDALREKAKAFGPTALDANDWHEVDLRNTLSVGYRAEGYVSFIDRHKSTEACEVVLRTGLEQLPALKKRFPVPFTCAAAWKIYFDETRVAFDAVPNSRKEIEGISFEKIYQDFRVDPGQ